MDIDISVKVKSQYRKCYEEGWQDNVMLRMIDGEVVIISCVHPEVELYVGLEELINAVNVLHRSTQPIKTENKR